MKTINSYLQEQSAMNTINRMIIENQIVTEGLDFKRMLSAAKSIAKLKGQPPEKLMQNSKSILAKVEPIAKRIKKQPNISKYVRGMVVKDENYTDAEVSGIFATTVKTILAVCAIPSNLVVALIHPLAWIFIFAAWRVYKKKYPDDPDSLGKIIKSFIYKADFSWAKYKGKPGSSGSAYTNAIWAMFAIGAMYSVLSVLVISGIGIAIIPLMGVLVLYFAAMIYGIYARFRLIVDAAKDPRKVGVPPEK